MSHWLTIPISRRPEGETAMNAIFTKYIRSTDTEAARMKAWDCDGNSITIPYPGAWGETNHRAVAESLREKMGWKGDMVSGDTKDGYVFVFIN